MKLSDIMSHAGLSGYAVAAMLLFMLAFLAIVWWLFRPANRGRWKRDAQIPLDDVHPQPPRDAED